MNDDVYKAKWEFVVENLQRMKVPGGWLVHHGTHIIHLDRDVAASECMIFLPDPSYTWTLEK